MLHLQTDTTPSHGNALQACVASLLGLEMEAVPNFVAAPEGYWEAMLAHAATLGQAWATLTLHVEQAWASLVWRPKLWTTASFEL